MKVPPKRKGNFDAWRAALDGIGLNESPSEKEGKFLLGWFGARQAARLNESPSEKEGKLPYPVMRGGGIRLPQ